MANYTIHGLKDDFEKIISLVKKKKPTVQDIVKQVKATQYHIYDVASMEIRLHILIEIYLY